MNSKYMTELENLKDEVVASLSRLEQLEELMSSAIDFANDAVAATLHDVAHKLGNVSMRIAALAWSINARS